MDSTNWFSVLLPGHSVQPVWPFLHGSTAKWSSTTQMKTWAHKCGYQNRNWQFTLEADAMWGTTIAFFNFSSPGFMYGSSWSWTRQIKFHNFIHITCSISEVVVFQNITCMEFSSMFDYLITSNTSRPTLNIGFAFKCSTRATSSITGPLLQFIRIASYRTIQQL